MSARVNNDVSSTRRKAFVHPHAHRARQAASVVGKPLVQVSNLLMAARGAELLLKLKLAGHLGQEAFERINRGFSWNLEEFFGITREGKIRIPKNELREKICFAEKLIQLPPNNLSSMDFKEEYDAYQRYERFPCGGFKKFADDFVQSTGDPAFDNYKTRYRIVSYLKLRSCAHDKRRAKIFLENLIVLKTKYNVDGIDRMLRLALKNEMAGFSRGSNSHGFYTHVDVALKLAQKPNLNVKGLAQVEIEFFDKPFPVPKIIGDIDIVATDENKTYLIEVKTSAYAVSRNGDTDQLDSLVELANDIDAIPVLLIGNIKTPDLKDLQQYKTTKKRDMVLKDLRDLIELINRYNGKLQIWDKNGDDITKKLLSYQKKPVGENCF